jgi:hypothetical protein
VGGLSATRQLPFGIHRWACLPRFWFAAGPDILISLTTDKILAAIDNEIAQLTKVRALLSIRTTVNDGASPIRKRRKLTAAARKKIAEARRKRWAKQKAAAPRK